MDRPCWLFSFAWGAAFVLAACRNTSTPSTPTSPAPASSSHAPDPLEPASELPPPAPALAAAELAGDIACGPFNTKDIQKNNQTLLDDRVSVHFLPNASPVGSAESGKIESKVAGGAIFIGAREVFQRGDENFERRATKVATFGGGYEPVTVSGRDGKVSIVTGVLRELNPKSPPPGPDEMVALAHGWFLDPNRDVLDVAVFVSVAIALKDLDACRRFAEKVISTATPGQRMLPGGSDAEVETKVSYAKFRYRLGKDWLVSTSMGIHDVSRMHFRKRGVFPKGYTELQLALDSHPGDWNSAGEPEGDRKGTLLGLPVTWHLTKDESSGAGMGAWTISEGKTNNDHAVASLQTTTARDRDEAIRFAESIRVGR